MELRELLEKKKAEASALKEVEFMGAKIKIKPLTLAELQAMRKDLPKGKDAADPASNFAFAKKLIKTCVDGFTDADLDLLNDCGAETFVALQNIVLENCGLNKLKQSEDEQEKN